MRLSAQGPPMSTAERVSRLQQLFFLYPQSEALTHYQRLRSQSVLNLLSALSTIPGGETGFDKLAAGFHSVAPVLTQTLMDELNTLSRLVEPRTVLGFLSAAYLSIVAQELTSLMEKECEMALRDNTSSYKINEGMGDKERHREGERWQEVECACEGTNEVAISAAKGEMLFTPFSRKYILYSIFTGPAVCLVKNRSFSLTSHQLRALTQLACTLLGFERTMQLLEFDWRSAFRGLAPHMAHCVKVVLDDACAKSLQQEEAFHSSGHTTITLSPVPERISLNQGGDCFGTYSERDIPKKIAKLLSLPIPFLLDCTTAELTSYPEGERCSFSVQMWFYFLCGLRSDLWAVLPAGSAKEVLGQVLSEILQLLVQRYATARPSYERHLQIRYLIMHRAGCSHAVIEFPLNFLNSYLCQIMQFQSGWILDKYSFPSKIILLACVKALINIRIIIQSVK
ncbi:unnamed protein product [Tetraodon nigroviridis]|uniref:(spotted green pufferfish) hypothetical protein n=1 Tax=Tetraodon nigroviridis TaxID=99883 RepID=Q4SG33_TETNG|nr:unnamed protein product [Tetraodon nigroviridis]